MPSNWPTSILKFTTAAILIESYFASTAWPVAGQAEGSEAVDSAPVGKSGEDDMTAKSKVTRFVHTRMLTSAAGVLVGWVALSGLASAQVPGGAGFGQPPGFQPPGFQPPGAQPPGAQPPGAQQPAGVRDPGVRGGRPGAGGPLRGLNTDETTAFTAARDVFAEVDSVSGTVAGEDGAGLGPRFNMNSCAGCHAQPDIGGSSPAINPQVAVATLDGARNTVPSFIKVNGPIREARFVKNPDGSPDGGVHDLFV